MNANSTVYTPLWAKSFASPPAEVTDATSSSSSAATLKSVKSNEWTLSWR